VQVYPALWFFKKPHSKRKGGETNKLMKTLKVMVASLLAFVGLVAATPAQAAQLQDVRVTMDDSGPGVRAPETIYFKHTTGATIARVRFQWCTTPSGGCVPPESDVSSADPGVFDGDLGAVDGTDWSITQDANTVQFDWTGAGDSVDITAGDDLSIQLEDIANGDLSSNCDNDLTNNSDTCFIRIATYDESFNLVDDGVGTYTIVSQVTVTATVDPTFKFTVTGVAAGLSYTNGVTSSVTTTPTTLPFGNLAVGTPKYATHALWVTTNTQGGYTVTSKMRNQMTGVYAVNNIDPFTTDWDSPGLWTEPNSQVRNQNTGWIGAHIDDLDVSNWSDTSIVRFGGIDDTENVVMRKASPDSGLAPNYVTYAVEVDQFQPSDAYAGTIMYNALPTY